MRRAVLLALGSAGALSLSTFVLSGCGSSSSGKGGGSRVKLVMKAINYGHARFLGGSFSLTAPNTNNGAPDGAPAMSILSGPPDAMNVYLQAITLAQSGAAPTTIWSSTESHMTDSGIPVTGCKIALTSGNPDLSGCPGITDLTIPAGTFTGLTLTFAEVGEIKGCLQGKFSAGTTSSATSGTYTYPTPFPQTPVSYTTEAVDNTTTYTFCTRKDQSYFNAETNSTTVIGSNASYRPNDSHFTGLTSPEFVAIDLSSGNGRAQTMAQLKTGTVSVNSSTVPTGSTTTLTLAVDLNRMLEFFANARSDFNPPNPAMHTGSSYFFTTKFQAVGAQSAVSGITAFAGDVGSVEGYQMTVAASSVAGWYTLYKDGSGNYLGGTMSEDDDDGLTILKGNASITSGNLTSGATVNLDIAGTLTSFTSLSAVGATASCGLSPSGSSSGGSTYTVNYKRLL